MRRRTFLGLLGGLGAVALLDKYRIPSVAAAVNRLAWWDPATIQQGVVLEWRYLAGRVTDAARDFGFVVSLVDYKTIPGIQVGRRELIVMRQDFATGTHTTRTYRGDLVYAAASATYSFTTNEAGATATASWQYDQAANQYLLSVNTPELAFDNLAQQPLGSMIPEGDFNQSGTGEVEIGNLGGARVESDYYADWVRLREGDSDVGYARFDIQTIRPQGAPSTTPSLTHHWFALAGELNGQPVWVSAWHLVTPASLHWGVTIARDQGATWSVSSTTEESAVAHPLTVDVLEWQSVPATDPLRRTGQRWRIRAGQSQPGDLIDIEIAVPPGQFIRNARVLNVDPNGVQLEEAVGTVSSGTIGGQALTKTVFNVGESTYTELDPGTNPEPDPTPSPTPDPTDPDYPVYLPLLR